MVFPVAHCEARGSLGPASELTALDLSAGGLRFRSGELFNPGDRAVIQMTSRSGTPGLVGLRIVHATRTVEGGSIYGACFVPLSPDTVRVALTQRPSAIQPDVRRHRASA